MRRSVLPLLLLAMAAPVAARAQAPDIRDALHRQDWPSAVAEARGMPDPVAQKLVTYFRLERENAAGAGEIAAFIGANPDWPNLALLLARRDEALAATSDDGVVLPLCVATPDVGAPRSGGALARCAAAAADLGHGDDAAAYARAAWVAGFTDAGAAAAFLARFGSVLTPADEQAKFLALLGHDNRAAGQELARISGPERALDAARLAVESGAADAAARVAALPAAARADPGLVRDRLWALLRTDDGAAALSLWRAAGAAAEQRAGAPAAGAFWALRARLARDRLAANDPRDAYALADDDLQTQGARAADKAFLAGFIALRGLRAPARAAAQFQRLTASRAVISQARAYFWLGEAAAAGGDGATARTDYARAARYPTTFYGQLAAARAGISAASLTARIDALTDPGWTTQQVLDFSGRELTRAAALLVAWGMPERARGFLRQLDILADDPATRSLIAHFAQGLGLPDQAVAAARLAGRYGTVLGQSGWPVPVTPPEALVPAPVSLGIIRQESSFDTGAVSPSGALGLMQLLPGTAREVGRSLGVPVNVAELTTDGALNMRLGTAYLGGLIGKFGGALPLAIAAYNAGPHRVAAWLDQIGDPRGQGTEAMIDWIERIPYGETRNYVQRVVENIVMYRARARQALPSPLGS